MLERHHDAPERVVVVQAERVAKAVEALALLVRGVSPHDLRERLLKAHGKTPARTLRTSPRHLPSSARLPMGSSFDATLSEMRRT